MENAKLSPIIQIILALLTCFTAALNFQGCDKHKQELMEARQANQVLSDSLNLMRDRAIYLDSVIQAIRSDNMILQANLEHQTNRVRHLDKGIRDIHKIIKAVQQHNEPPLSNLPEEPIRAETVRMVKN